MPGLLFILPGRLVISNHLLDEVCVSGLPPQGECLTLAELAQRLTCLKPKKEPVAQ